ncbi:uncharacterized protein LOC131017936 [Salvia miltiorrhiza]|uniref:uncharacterized protein LOC131017936 n=1 Tax=Salvia miltiorrhiza TaxID=226208 RepID=UPI0025ACE442|nr:uncharacterized protein LOC131017936 [Salvia miltiorrhiza]
MTLVIRCVDMTSSSIMIKEYFIEFISVDDTSGLALFNEIQAALESLGLDIDNVRGQGYDNGSNMKGKHQVVQRLYTLFASSTKRWKFLQDHLNQFTLKSLSTTRWESHINSVTAIITQPNEIREALFELARVSDDAKTRSEAESLATNELENFEFLLGMTIWHNILNKTNLISKKLQSKDMQIDVAIVILKGLISYFEKYREDGFQSALTLAKELASKMEIDPIFPPKRMIRRKKQFDESCQEEITLSDEEFFRINYFLVIVDIAILSLKTRFEQLTIFEDIFGFLFPHKMLSLWDSDKLHKCCVKLQDALKHNDKFDIDAEDLYSELQVLQMCLPSETKSLDEVLEFVKVSDCFPNVSIAYRILLTIPVTVASAERSFSKLKLIKSYLRSTMSQERLNGLAVLCIEHEVLEKLDLEEIIDDFASQNARRSKLFL